MANIGKIYSEAISLTPKEREDKGFKPRDEVNPNPDGYSPAEDAATAQEKITWLQSPITASLLKDLGHQCDDAINDAIKLAVGYSSHQNPYRIIQLLNKAHELKQIIHHYGRTTRNSH